MKCPNCRCEIDPRMATCPYCGAVLRRKKNNQRDRTRVNAEYQQGYTIRAERRTETKRHERQRGRNNRVYFEIIILLLAALTALELLELIAIILK